MDEHTPQVTPATLDVGVAEGVDLPFDTPESVLLLLGLRLQSVELGFVQSAVERDLLNRLLVLGLGLHVPVGDVGDALPLGCIHLLPSLGHLSFDKAH